MQAGKQSDVAPVMVLAEGNVTLAIAKGKLKAGEIQSQTRQHSRHNNLVGVKEISDGLNEMDCETTWYKQSRNVKFVNGRMSMLVKGGWKKDFIDKNTSYLPISGWMGDDLLKLDSTW